MSSRNPVVGYYDGFDEWGRLDTPAGRLELERALAILDRHMPANSTVLDIGGGPGRYTLALAERGHTVTLADVTPKLLDEARRRVAASSVGGRVVEILERDAADLAPLADASFDAVVSFGPFYHLIDRGPRERAVTELHRVLRTGGVAFVAFIPRWSGVAGLIDRAVADPEQVPASVLERALRDGVFVNPTDRGFQNGYYPHVGELKDLFRSRGFSVEACPSVRGLCSGREEGLQRLRGQDPSTAAAEDRVLDATADEDSVVALGGHAIFVVRREPR